MSIQLLFRNSLAAIKLVDSVPNLGLNRHFILCKPAILLFLSFEQACQEFSRSSQKRTGGAFQFAFIPTT